MQSARRLTLLAYLQLTRAPNLFTAIADVTMGFLVARRELTPLSSYVCLLVASCLLYAAGTTLNDVYDIERDKRERLERPLPSGRIPLAGATRLGYVLLGLGVMFGSLAGLFCRGETSVAWRSGLIAVVLAGCIVLYDAAVKDRFAGPLVMGACRSLNILMGMSLGAITERTAWLGLGYSAAELLVAASLGVYVAGLTWFARGEAEGGHRTRRLLGLTVMLAGLVLLTRLPEAFTPLLRTQLKLNQPEFVWPLLLLLLSVAIVRRCLTAVADPSPRRVQEAVKLGILSLIVFDAAVSLLVTGLPGAVGVLCLLAPALLLGRWVYST